jgi:hypothetical protein
MHRDFNLPWEALNFDTGYSGARRFVTNQFADFKILVELVKIIFAFSVPAAFPGLVDL